MSDGSSYIFFVCRHCGLHLAVRHERGGKTIHCEHCRCAVRVPRESTCQRPRPEAAPVSVDDPSGETIFGEPVVLEVAGGHRKLPAFQVVPIERADVAEPGGPITMRRLAGPLSSGAMVAGFLVVAMMLIIHSTTPPKRTMASPPGTRPAMTRPR